MASTSTPGRGVKRILQACNNCRRKKTRCPGEKPKCSNCTRLSQQCQYPGYDFEGSQHLPSSSRTVEDRLAQVEEKLDLILERPVGSPRQGETPHTLDDRHDTSPPTSPSTQRPRASYSRLLPQDNVISRALDVYFLCCHRQPVWLFEARGDLSSDSAEELVLTILGLSTLYAPDEFSEFQLRDPGAYNDAARSLIMLKVANSTVDMSMLQALCLLAFANLTSANLQLASFHIGLVGSLLQCSGLDSHISQDRTSSLEEQRRLFWSIRALHALCGLHTKAAFPIDMHAPRYLVVDETLRNTGTQAPLLPHETHNDQGQMALGVWAHMVRSATLWEEVRLYLARCAEGQAKDPWHPESGYTAINAHLFDMECAFPQSYRFDSAKFHERSKHEIFDKRDFWLPWMKIQVTYHTLYSVLNHPFLYSSRATRPKPGPNGFWKTSTDLALLHSTWIARLIGLAKSKSLELADPFFAYAASVAVTLHLYWSRASDSKIRSPAQDNLATCRSFIADMATHWPICQMISDDVDRFVQLVSSSTSPVQGHSSSFSAHTSLMWKILRFTTMSHSKHTGRSLFHPSLENSVLSRASSHDQVAIDEPELDDPPEDYQTSTGAYAAPPDWYSPMTSSSPQATRQQLEGQPHMFRESFSNHSLEQVPVQQNHPTAAVWTWRPGDAYTAPDPWSQFYERGGAEQGWWEYGNL
ncbi:uncharacterized protein HMPREF1541_02760 [Cyphellophora europaea CBS 101466]|uniref:Zn(2)-C6 fungal-type domain-containing protein n=1 Tax=Cyphellophora europaea (strain CBS 101466) TaxID=1220924 RepID=W2S4H0_CYPE1|nr:uncharacterized protein HMPREF1541_02760 [Cyphellophora europaea CBS 101466]ETN43601.1 hypothetical protein HMPREF1541_02760 [Cyphellophora europaea CBS 101466]